MHGQFSEEKYNQTNYEVYTVQRLISLAYMTKLIDLRRLFHFQTFRFSFNFYYETIITDNINIILL